MAAGSVVLFLLIYLFIMLKPVVPYLDYLVRKDFIMENLCVNREKPEKQCKGKCHLEKQLRKEINGSEQDHAPPPPRIDREEIPKYLISGGEEHLSPAVKKMEKSSYYRSYSFQYVPYVFHPPICGINAPGTREFS